MSPKTYPSKPERPVDIYIVTGQPSLNARLKRIFRRILPAHPIRTAQSAKRTSALYASSSAAVWIVSDKSPISLNLPDIGALLSHPGCRGVLRLTSRPTSRRPGGVHTLPVSAVDDASLVREFTAVLSAGAPAERGADADGLCLDFIGDALFDLVCILDERGAFRYANKSWRALCPLSEPLRELHLADFIHPNDASRFQAEFNLALSHSETRLTVMRIHSVKGWQTLQIRLSRAGTAGENVVILTARNMTELHLTRQSLQETEQRYQLFENSVSDVLYRFSLVTRQFQFVSPSFTELTGYPVAEVLAEPWTTLRKIIHPEDFAPTIGRIKAALNASDAPKTIMVEFRFVRKDGRTIWVEDKIDFERNRDGEQVWVNGIIRDITEWREAQQKLRDNEAQLQNLFDTMLEGVVVFEALHNHTGEVVDFRLVKANSGFSSVAGLDGGSLPDSIFSEKLNGFADILVARNPHRTLLEEFRRVVKYGGTAYHSEVYWPSRDRFLNIGLSQPTSGQLAVTIMDITRLVTAEVRLRNLLHSLPDTVLYQTGGGIEYISANIEQLIGHPAERITSDRTFFPTLIHPVDNERLKGVIADWLQKGAPNTLELEYRVKRSDGEYIWLVDRMTVAFRTPDGRHSYQGILVDWTARREAEEQLRRRTDELEAIFTAFPDLFFRVDKNNIIKSYRAGNPADLYLPAEKFLSKSITKVLPSKVAKQFRAAISRCKRNGSLQVIEYDLDVPSGSQSFEARIVPLLDDEFALFVRNITERKRQQRELRKQLEHQRALGKAAAKLNELRSHDEMVDLIGREMVNASASQVGIFVIGDAEGMVIAREWHQLQQAPGLVGVAANASDFPVISSIVKLREAIVLTNEEVPAATILPKVFPGGFSVAVVPVVHSSELHGILALVHPDKHWFKASDVELFKSYANLLGNALERARRVEQVERSRAFLDSLFRQSPVPTWIADISGTMIRQNAACAKLLGRDDEQVLGKYNIFNDPELESQGVLGEFRRLFSAGEPIQASLKYILSEHSDLVLWLRATAFPIKDAAGRVINAIVQYDDQTTEQSLQDQLLQAQKMESIGTLAGGVAHDFNNILTGILGYTSFLRERHQAADETADILKQIESSAQQAAEVIRQLLNVSRRDISQPKTIDARDLLQQCLAMVKLSIPSTVRISVNIPDEPLLVHGDEVQLKQTILNMCINARDAMPKGGELLLKAGSVFFDHPPAAAESAAQGEYVRIDIRDTGPGIAPEVLPRIFDPFFTTKAVDEGTGLGLAIAYRVVQNHKGWIEVSSVAKRGAQFKVYLPRLSGQAPAEAPGGRATSARQGNELIMIADDEPTIREMTQKILTTLGYRVLTAVDGREVIAKLEQLEGKIDLLLLDLTMPHLAGADAFKIVRERWPKIKVLLSSGYDFGEEVSELMALGVEGFIPKPYRAAQLSEKLRLILD